MADSVSSRLQAQATADARQAARRVAEYQRLLPMGTQPAPGGGMCRADGWNVSLQQLDGDFALDPALAKQLISGAIASPDIETKSSAQWLKEYLSGSTSGEPWSMKRIESEAINAAVGPGNILGNTKAVGDAIASKRTADAIKAGLEAIETGKRTTVQINQYTTLYNANKSGKGAPRPRIRFRGLPVKVVAEALEVGVRAAAHGPNAAMRVNQALQAARIGGLAAAHTSAGKPAFWGKMTRGGGILTFGPSAAIDLNNNISRDIQGNINFNGRGFVKDSLKSQSGNLLGYGVGLGAGAVAVAFGVAGAPVILIVLFAGILMQAAWGFSGGSDLFADAADKALN